MQNHKKYIDIPKFFVVHVERPACIHWLVFLKFCAVLFEKPTCIPEARYARRIPHGRDCTFYVNAFTGRGTRNSRLFAIESKGNLKTNKTIHMFRSRLSSWFLSPSLSSNRESHICILSLKLRPSRPGLARPRQRSLLEKNIAVAIFSVLKK